MFAASKTAAAAAGTPPPSTDPQFNYVTMLLHGDGTNGAQNNTFVSEPVVVPSGVGYLAGQFNGTADFLTTSSGPTLSGDFTLEAWVFMTSVPSFSMLVGEPDSDSYIALRPAGVELSFRNVTYPNWSFTFNNNTWYHFAVSRQSGTVRCFVNGQQLSLSSGSSTNTTTFSDGPLFIGKCRFSPFYYFPGYISNFRIVDGTAFYTSNFSVPTSPLTAISGTSLLTCQSGSGATFADNSTNNFTITRTGTPTMTGVATTPPGAVPYAGSFNGSSQSLSLANNTAFDFGTGDFTIEGWVWLDSTVNPGRPDGLKTVTVFSTGSSGSNDCSFAIYGNTSVAGVGLELYQASPAIAITAASTVPTDSWAHVAFVRSGTTIYGFVNGVRSTLGTTSSAIGSGVAPKIGMANTTSYANRFKGNVSNFRVVKGTAVYTLNFAPPSSPLTAITNTSLLTCQSSTFIDNSPNNFTITNTGSTPVVSSYILPTITRNGTPTQGSFSPYGTLWSNYITSGQRLTVAANTALNITGGAFTLEAWVYPTSFSTPPLIFVQDNGYGNSQCFQFRLEQTNGKLGFIYWTSSSRSSAVGVTTTNSTVLNQWSHVAAVYTGSTLYLFIDGVMGFSGSVASMFSASIPTTIGNFTETLNNVPLNGYISNVRIVKGTALYTSAFTPSTTPLTAVSGTSLLTCQSNRFIDNSSNNFAITVTGTPSVQRFSPFDPAAEYSTSVIGGSGQFSSNTSYLTAASNAAFAFPGEFTVEGWFYWTTIPSAGQITGVLASGGFNITYNTTLQFNLYGTGSIASATFTPVVGRWYHIAMTRNASNLCTVWIDGVSSATGTSSASFVQGAWSLYGGSNNGGAGYVSNLRVVKGTAVYTAAFTPPTAPLTAITNTSLLLNTVNAGIFDNAMMNDLVTVGNAQVSTAVKKYGTGSMYFDGTGDYLDTATQPWMDLTSGDFTIEGWFYATAFKAGVDTVILAKDAQNGVTYPQWAIEVNSASKLFGDVGTGASGTGEQKVTGTTTLSLNTWYYFAFTKSGTTLRLFLNGTLEASATQTITMSAGTYPLRIGGQNNTTAKDFAGYIDDLRITKGYARYTANFTPPTAALPNN